MFVHRFRHSGNLNMQRSMFRLGITALVNWITEAVNRSLRTRRSHLIHQLYREMTSKNH